MSGLLKAPLSEKSEFLWLVLQLYRYKLMICLLPYIWYKNKIVTQANDDLDLPSDYRQKVIRLKRNLHRTRRVICWRDTFCLVNALVVKDWAKNHRIPVTMHLGLRKQDDQLEAHAWVSCANEVIVGDENITSYTEIFHSKNDSEWYD